MFWAAYIKPQIYHSILILLFAQLSGKCINVYYKQHIRKHTNQEQVERGNLENIQAPNLKYIAENSSGLIAAFYEINQFFFREIDKDSFSFSSYPYGTIMMHEAECECVCVCVYMWVNVFKQVVSLLHIHIESMYIVLVQK